MPQFSIKVAVEQFEDPEGLTRFGFTHEGTAIHDPYASTCGRFEVDPAKEYGLDKASADGLVALNLLLTGTTEAAIDGVRQRLPQLGVPQVGKEAFEDEANHRAFRKAAAAFLQSIFPQLGITPGQ